jgi:hypothetical protein
LEKYNIFNFNYKVKTGWGLTNGVTRLHYSRSKWEDRIGYEVGVNILPGRFGVFFYLWIINIKKALAKKLVEKQNHIGILKELITLLNNPVGNYYG